MAGTQLFMGHFLTSTETTISADESDAKAASAPIIDSIASPHNTIEMAFSPCDDPTAGAAYTWRLAHQHYENFPVVSILLPARLRQDFCNVYAFCRTADDLGDEVGDPQRSLELLARFREQTTDMFSGKPRSAIFVALRETVVRHQIPIQPFLDLIDAFEQDQRVDRYETFQQLADYCRRSADPVGRLVLYMCDYHDDQRQQLSDCTCTALQLTNFWQDVRRDLEERKRIYLPAQTMRQFNVTEDQIRAGQCTDGFRQCISFEVDRAEKLFDQGDALLPMLDDGCRAQVMLFGQGGRAILKAIRRQNFDTLSRRPELSRWQMGRLVFQALVARLAQVVSQEPRPEAQR